MSRHLLAAHRAAVGDQMIWRPQLISRADTRTPVPSCSIAHLHHPQFCQFIMRCADPAASAFLFWIHLQKLWRISQATGLRLLHGVLLSHLSFRCLHKVQVSCATTVRGRQPSKSCQSATTHFFDFFLALQSSCAARTTRSLVVALSLALGALQAGFERPSLTILLVIRNFSPSDNLFFSSHEHPLRPSPQHSQARRAGRRAAGRRALIFNFKTSGNTVTDSLQKNSAAKSKAISRFLVQNEVLVFDFVPFSARQSPS